MNENTKADNPLLADLLDFQQDGKAAEVGPHNWSQEPSKFPIVRTRYLDSILQSAELLGADSENGVWHFLVGAPGNGKSALVGALVRHLLSNGWDYLDKKGSGLTLEYITTLTSGDGITKRFAKLLIVQDASVSASPHDPEANLAQELLRVLVDSYGAGRSIVVCANRGVLEQIPELVADLDGGKRFKFLKKGIESDHSVNVRFAEAGGNRVYKEVTAKFDHLDTESITRPPDSDTDAPIQQLLKGLLDSKSWSACSSCSANQLCPFLGNRNLLRVKSVQARFLRLLRAAETYRGQPIVFREALALFSTILAGVPSDYEDQSPCEWVQAQHRDLNLFALIDRRVYQVLFCGRAVVNFSESAEIRKTQLQDFLQLKKSSIDEKKQVDSLLEDWPSIISASPELRGSLSSLDPTLVGQDEDVADFASYDSDALLDALEEKQELWALECLAIRSWRALSLDLQNDASEDSEVEVRIRGLRLLMRITGLSLLRLCALALPGSIDCKFRNENELDEYMSIIDLIRAKSTWLKDDTKWLSEQESMIDEHVRSATGAQATYTKVMENLEVRSEGQTDLAPLRLCREVHPPFLMLGLSFSDNDKSDADLSAQAYCWIRKTREQSGATMISESIPSNLLSGIRVARRNAVAKSRYLEAKSACLATDVVEDDGRTVRKILRKDKWSGNAEVEDVTN